MLPACKDTSSKVTHRFIRTFQASMKACSFLRAFAKLQKATIIFVMSVCPHGSPRLTFDRLSLNLRVFFFQEICRENSSFVNSGQEQRVIYMKTHKIFDHISLCSSQNEKCFRKKEVVEKIKTRILRSVTFFSNIMPFRS